MMNISNIENSRVSHVSTQVSTNDSEVVKLQFLRYVKTLQFMTQKYKGVTEEKPVHISQKEIETRFFVYPKFNRKESIIQLVQSHRLKVNQDRFFTYECLEDVELDFSLLPVKKDNFVSVVIESIRETLRHVSLKSEAESTDYFDKFLKYKNEHIKIFFTVDNFAGRIHTPVTNLHREYRENILLLNEETVSFDVATMQPVLLGKILFHHIGNNEYSQWINDGLDIYVMLQEKASLKTRDEAKKRFFEMIFARPSDTLSNMFGRSNWINWINEYKTLVIPDNPHNHVKRYSNLAWKLQTTEVKIMYQVWNLLYRYDIPFLTIHDEVRVRMRDSTQAESIFMQVLENEFQYFKLNTK